MGWSELDPAEVAAFSFNVWGYKQGEMVALMIHLGDRLGLYRALAGAGALTAGELAERTGLRERWLLEWLRGQVAARLLELRPPDRFELAPAGAAVLADEESSLAFAGGAFSAPLHPEVVDRIAEAFQTGLGLSYDQLGAGTAHAAERMLGPWARLALLPEILPVLEGVVAKLEAGATVADVGCGSGVALLTMASAFPKSEFQGFDPSRHAIARATDRLREAGLRNLRFAVAGGEELPREPTFDLVTTFDCMHDMTRPDAVTAAIRRALLPDGTWLIKDIRSRARFEDNLRNPLLALFYAFSVSACMSSALSEPGGAGLGTLGFHPGVAREMAEGAGFTRFRILDLDDPSNLYYEVRP